MEKIIETCMELVFFSKILITGIKKKFWRHGKKIEKPGARRCLIIAHVTQQEVSDIKNDTYCYTLVSTMPKMLCL